MFTLLLFSQRMMREMSVWFGLTFARHSNIVGSFGFITDVPGGFGLVAPYFSNGGVMEYLKNNPSANRSEIVGVATISGIRRLTDTFLVRRCCTWAPSPPCPNILPNTHYSRRC